MKNQKKYKAFTLFEIIVSIIILGIVMTSFPFIFNTMAESNKQVMKEEVFFEEFSLLSLINTRYWDENNTMSDNFYKDLNATGGDTELLNNYTSIFAGKTSRIGKTQFNNTILRSGSSDTTSNIGIDSGEIYGDVTTYDDIDDFNGLTQTFLGKTISVNVNYINDNANYNDQNITFNLSYTSTSSKTNIKLITISEEYGDSNITLRYPSCNIGASKFLSYEELSR